MGEFLQSSDSLGVAVLWFKYDGPLERLNDAALAGNPEFGREVGMNVGDNLQNQKSCISLQS